MQRTDSLEKTLMREKIEGKRRSGSRGWDGWIASPTQWTWIWANSRRYWRTEELGVPQCMGLQRIRHNLATEQQWHSAMQQYPGVSAFQGEVMKGPWAPPVSEPSLLLTGFLALGLQGWPHLDKSEQWFPHEKSGSLALGKQQQNFFSLYILIWWVWAITINKDHWVF